jgi:hypothetical protein
MEATVTKERAKPVFTTLMLSLLLILASVLLPGVAEAWNPVLRPVYPRIDRVRQQALIQRQLQRVRLRSLSRQLKGQIRTLKQDQIRKEVRQEVQKLIQSRNVLP